VGKEFGRLCCQQFVNIVWVQPLLNVIEQLQLYRGNDLLEICPGVLGIVNVELIVTPITMVAANYGTAIVERKPPAIVFSIDIVKQGMDGGGNNPLVWLKGAPLS
jgi:hypothetical protein